MIHLFILSTGLFIAAVLYATAVLKGINDEIKKDKYDQAGSVPVNPATRSKAFCDEDVFC